jgi:hypothetical protein
MAITLLGQHLARERWLSNASRARSASGVWVDAQHDPTDFTPVLFVIHSKLWSGWREISDLRIELRLFHTGPRFLAKRIIKDSYSQLRRELV